MACVRDVAMYLDTQGSFVRTDIWREGAYLDLWSVPHFLSGIVVGGALFFSGFAIRDASIIAFLLLVIYEMWEVMVQIEETRWNRVLDVVVGMTSCVSTLIIAPHLDRNVAIPLFVAVGTADGVLSYFGWQASQKASVLETKLRLELAEQKRALGERVGVAKAKWQERRLRRRMQKAARTPR